MNESEIIRRIDDLIARTNLLLDFFEEGENYYGIKSDYLKDPALFPALSAQLLNFFDSFSDVLFPKNRYLDKAAYYLNIAPKNLTSTDIKTVIEILKALKHDIINGYLERYSTYVTAGVFNDFITMSKRLCENENGLLPAASLSTAVLEDSLRRIASTNNIPVEEADTLGSLNQKCYGVRAYQKNHLQLINGWAAIRNDADHGHFELFEGQPYAKKDIELMISGIEQFLASYLK